MKTDNLIPTGSLEQTRSIVLRRIKHGGLDRPRVYSLYCDGEDSICFRIAITDGDEAVDMEIVASFAEVADLFDKIVMGDLPPYILPEILADFVSARI